MCSIGLLGFLVWSLFMMAQYFAICWNNLTLLGTFYSKNLNNYTQSAGNLNSSETTRKKYCNIWFTWLIGFSEGEELTHKII